MKDQNRNTLIDLFERSVEKFPNNIFLFEKQKQTWTETSYSQTYDKVLRFGAGLVKLGVKPTYNIALLS